MKTFALLTSLILLTISGFAQKEIRLTAADNGKTFSYLMKNKGTLISIEVPDNSGSTGYVWSESNSNANTLKFMGKSFIGPKDPMPGAPGTSVYTYQLTGKPGTSKVTLELKRGNEVAADKGLTFTFKVKKPQPKPAQAPATEPTAQPEPKK